MENIECEKCGRFFEIETIHTIIDVPEHVEFNMCEECFKKDLQTNIEKENEK